MSKDKFILNSQPKSEGYKPVMLRTDAYEMLKQMQEDSGASLSYILSEAIKFASERLVIDDSNE